MYTVQSGDSLSSISEKLYGDFTMTNELARLNKISNPNYILPGQKLIVPDIKTVYKDDAEVVETAPVSKTKEFIAKAFPWAMVVIAAYLLGREAWKQKKKNKMKAAA